MWEAVGMGYSAIIASDVHHKFNAFSGSVTFSRLFPPIKKHFIIDIAACFVYILSIFVFVCLYLCFCVLKIVCL